MGRRCADESCILQELIVQLEVESWLEHLNLVQRDVLKLGIEAGHSLVYTWLVSEEGSDGACSLHLGSSEIVEIKSIIESCAESLHKRVILRQSCWHFAHASEICDAAHPAELDCIFDLFVGKDVCSWNSWLSWISHKSALHKLLQLARWITHHR